jgi:hypothetical protein
MITEAEGTGEWYGWATSGPPTTLGSGARTHNLELAEERLEDLHDDHENEVADRHGGEESEGR